MWFSNVCVHRLLVQCVKNFQVVQFGDAHVFRANPMMIKPRTLLTATLGDLSTPNFPPLDPELFDKASVPLHWEELHAKEDQPLLDPSKNIEEPLAKSNKFPRPMMLEMRVISRRFSSKDRS